MKTKVKPHKSNDIWQSFDDRPLKETLADLLSLFNEYADKHDLSISDRRKFEALLYEFYLHKKAEIYIQDKVSDFNIYLKKLLNQTFSNVFTNDKSDQYEIFYYNKKNHLTINE